MAGEYRISAAGESLVGFNRQSGLRVTWNDGAASVLSTRQTKRDALALRATNVGRAGTLQAFGTGDFALGKCRSDGAKDERGECLRRIERSAGGVIEYWENRPGGIEQGFVLATAPKGTGKLRVDVEIKGGTAKVDDSEGGATIAAKNGQRYRYEKLIAWDADGKHLASRMLATRQGVTLEVDDTGAKYPVTIDPVLTTPAAFTVEADEANAGTDVVVGSAGDVNGDGYDDVFVAWPNFDGGLANQGRVLVYHGGAAGPDTTADFTLLGGAASSALGRSAARAGDVNNDGFGDLIIGQTGYTNGQANEGRIHLVYGAMGGLGTGTATSNFESDSASAFLGRSVASAGDIDGDGFDDVVAGANGFDVTTNEGRFYVFKGSAGGLVGTPSDTITSAIAGANLGFFVNGAGDVNGDGRDDIIVSATAGGGAGTGISYIHLGNADGTITDAPSWTFAGTAASSLGPVSGAGDINGDGYADVIAGEYLLGGTHGAVHIFYGASGGPSTTPSLSITPANGARFGRSVGGGGDINGDGYADIVVGAYLAATGLGADVGSVYAFLGGPTGPATTVTLADQQFDGDQVSGHLGSWVANAGDVNGDGYADVIAAAETYANGQANEGRAYLYLGGAERTGIAAANDWTVESDTASAAIGAKVASGDFNGDGFADVAAAASGTGTVTIYHGAAAGPSTTAATTITNAGIGFGSALAAGDINGDGFDDLVVGAPTYANGQTDEGRVYVYSGASGGLGTTPVTFESDIASARLGTAVAATDLNADGRFEVVIGAPGVTNPELSEGRVYAFLGAPSGVNFASTPTTFESDSNNAVLGTALAGAGDVDGDGFGDVAAGAPGYSTNQGRIYAILGAVTGLSATARTADGAAGSQLGASIASAGDVTGDGFADIVAGAPSYANGEANEGRVSVYPGGAGGFGAVFHYEPNVASAFLGTSVAGGDMNGDGLGDIAGGAYNDSLGAGKVSVFLAAAGGGGLPGTPSGTASEGGGAQGTSVATGDVNGDSVSDVITGAPTFANGQAGEGRVALYLGNRGGRGFRVRAQNAAGTPNAMRGAVAPSALTSLRVAANASSWVGRAGIKLEVEIKPVATAFNGTSTVDAAFTDTGAGNAAVALQQTFTGLTMASAHHFRTRLVYSPTEHRIQRKSPWIYGGVLGNSTGVGVRLDNLLAAGAACTLNAECGSGFCADGVCCNSACGGGSTTDCQACSIATGAAANGVCGNRTAGLSCSDGSMCTTTDVCDGSGVCGGTAVTCTASDQCHDVGVCNPGTGVCSNPAKTDGASCSDSNMCTTTDTCQAGVCTAGTPVTCTASDQCHDVGVCDTTTGACSNPVKANGTTCSDGNACTSGETCQIGTCTPATSVTCAAPDQCHTAGTCNTTTGTCVYPNKADGTTCNDANACTASDTCVAGACVGASPITCTASDQCHDVGVCDTVSGLCSNPAKANGTTCNDGSMCTTTDVCTAGVCGGTAVTCNDSNACTNDSCVAGTGCVYMSIPSCTPTTPPDAGTDADAADAQPDVTPETGTEVRPPDVTPETGTEVRPPDATPETGTEVRPPDATPDTPIDTSRPDTTTPPVDTGGGEVRMDAKTDAPNPVPGGGGCDCDVGKRGNGAPVQALLIAGLGLLFIGRRRRLRK